MSSACRMGPFQIFHFFIDRIHVPSTLLYPSLSKLVVFPSISLISLFLYLLIPCLPFLLSVISFLKTLLLLLLSLFSKNPPSLESWFMAPLTILHVHKQARILALIHRFISPRPHTHWIHQETSNNSPSRLPYLFPSTRIRWNYIRNLSKTTPAPLQNGSNNNNAHVIWTHLPYLGNVSYEIALILARFNDRATFYLLFTNSTLSNMKDPIPLLDRCGIICPWGAF